MISETLNSKEPVAADRGRTDMLREDGPRLALAVVVVGVLGAALSVPFQGVPNVAPLFVVVFLAGILAGPWLGLLVGAFGTVLYAGLVGIVDYHTIGAALGMAEAGGLAGLLARRGARSWSRLHPWHATALAALTGVVFTIIFSLTADTTEWVLTSSGLVAAGHSAQLGGVVLAGLSFNWQPALANGVLFGLFAVPAFRLVEWLARSSWAGPMLGPIVERLDRVGA